MRSEVYPLETLRSPIAIEIMYLSTVDQKKKSGTKMVHSGWVRFFRFALT